MTKKIMHVLLFSFSFISAFHYDKAAHRAQRGEWSDVHEALNDILINQPDRADVLYDAGVAAYNLEKFSQACAYFSRAAEYSDSVHLKKRAFFNAGNACVACQQLEDALAQYDAILAFDENDEYARHNRDAVAEMIKKKQEQEQKQKQDQEKQSKDKQHDDHQKNDSQQGQEKQNDQQGNDQQDNDGQQSDDQNKDQGGSEKQSQNKEGRDGADSSNGDAGKDERNKKEDGANGKQDKQRDGDHHSQNEPDQKQGDNNSQQRNKHDATPDSGDEKSHQKDDSSVTSQGDKEQGVDQENGTDDAQRQGQKEMASAVEGKLKDPLLVRLLEQQEARDKAVNKQLMEVKIRQNGGRNGQNCW